MNRVLSAAAFGCAGLLASSLPARAHVVAGARVFPVTLTLDDPGVSDEVSIPALTYARDGADGGTGPTHEYDLGFEYDKTITPTTALILNDGGDVFQTNGSRTRTGLENLVVTGKWQVCTSAAHEFVVSLGISREIGGTGTSSTGADAHGSTTPSLYAGKGLGDLPIGLLRPFAVTGELSYTIADKGLKTLPAAQGGTGDGIAGAFNDGSNNAWFGGASFQYSIPYLQSQVRDVGLPSVIGSLVPVVEVNWSSPASAPSAQGTRWTVAPGLIYLAQWGEIGVEALIPANKAAGSTVGAVALLHLFLDDLFPHGIGRPIVQ